MRSHWAGHRALSQNLNASDTQLLLSCNPVKEGKAIVAHEQGDDNKDRTILLHSLNASFTKHSLPCSPAKEGKAKSWVSCTSFALKPMPNTPSCPLHQPTSRCLGNSASPRLVLQVSMWDYHGKSHLAALHRHRPTADAQIALDLCTPRQAGFTKPRLT